MTPWDSQGPRAGKVSPPFSCSSNSTVPSSGMLEGMLSGEWGKTHVQVLALAQPLTST